MKKNTNTPLAPLVHSFDENQLEVEIKRGFCDAFERNFRLALDDINVQGAAHLGSIDLITKNITADGLAVVRKGEGDELTHLFMAWRGQNPRRGLHFLATYLQLTWPNKWEINSLWQKKDTPYPTGLVIESVALQDRANYFKTSRISVSLELDDAESSDELYNIIPVLHTALAARLIIEPKKLKRVGQDIGVTGAYAQHNFIYFVGDYVPEDNLENPVGAASGQNAQNFANFVGELIV
jgi:hypothetical protein